MQLRSRLAGTGTDALVVRTLRGAFAALVDGHDEVARPLVDRVRLAAVLRLEPLDRRTRVDPRLGDVQRVARASHVLLARVGDGRADDLLDHPARALLAETQQRERVVDVTAADQVHDQPRLARGDSGESVFSFECHVSTSHFAQAAPGAAAFLPEWPRNVRVGENSPSLCPTMSSCTNTFRNLFPLCTSNVCPTNSGMMVHARAQVLMGCLARFSFSLETLR